MWMCTKIPKSTERTRLNTANIHTPGREQRAQAGDMEMAPQAPFGGALAELAINATSCEQNATAKAHALTALVSFRHGVLRNTDEK
jgi:hypothetical protein